MVLGKLDYSLNTYIKINSKRIKDLNVRYETIRLLGKNIGSTLFDTGLSNTLLGMSQARETKATINKWDYIQLKIFCTVKETINKMKRPPTEWEKIFANNISDKGSHTRTYRWPTNT